MWILEGFSGKSALVRPAAIAVVFGWALLSASESTPLDLTGTAIIAGSAVRLTPADREKVGAAWWPEKQRVRDGFQAGFEFQISDRGGIERGADGFAFVLQNSGLHALGGRGSAGGFALGDGYGNPDRPGIPESLAVFFDTFKNRDAKDPSGNYIGIFTNGPTGQMRWPPPRLGFTKKLPFHLKDGRVHSVRIAYKTPLMTVFLDGAPEPVLSVPVDLTPVVDSAGRAYVGFTASTGDGYENHDILNWSLTSSTVEMVDSSIRFLDIDCMEGRNLCTPKQAVVEGRGAGKFHIVLPPQIDWPASVPNASREPVEISHAQGHVCWDLRMPGRTGCSGPEGIVIHKNEGGRTWFSVKRPDGCDPASTQGFFEFDVSVP